MIQGLQKQCSKVSDVQIHKFTKTASATVAERPNMSYIFEKVMVQGPTMFSSV